MDISYNVSLTGSKGGASLATGYGAGSFDMAGSDMCQATQTIASGTEVLNLGDVSAGSVGLLYVKSLADAGSPDVLLSYNADGSAPFAKVRAGVFPTTIEPTSGTIYAKATAPTRLAVAAASL